LLTLLAVPAAAGAQTVNPPEPIVAAAADCWQVVGRGGVDLAALAAKGWKAAELKEQSGKPVASPLKFFGKESSGVVVMVLPQSGACSVVSGVSGIDAYRPLMDQLQTRIKQLEPTLKAGRAGSNGAAFIGGGRVALIEPTGTKEQPSVRYTVTAEAVVKKGR
jgi:hypothetical protein